VEAVGGEGAEVQKKSTGKMLGELIKDKDLFKVILVTVLWNIANYVSMPFYGTYQIKELGFTMTFVSVLSALYAVCRSLFSRPMGKFADKYSFAKMLSVCFIIKAFAFLINTFTVPANGKIFYTTYYMLTAVAMAGINSATINLIYDYVDQEKRMSALALNATFSGFAGFFTTLAISPLVKFIQNNNNTFMGMHVYAQQVVSAISLVLVLVLLVYLNTVVKKLKAKRS
jgi:MFS family permease